jgi:hypothetical protein
VRHSSSLPSSTTQAGENAMNKRYVQLVSLIAMLLSVLSFAGFARFTSAEETAKANIFANDPALKDLINYRQWTRANENAVVVTTLSFSQDEALKLSVGG